MALRLATFFLPDRGDGRVLRFPWEPREHRWVIGPRQKGWRWGVIGKRADCPMVLRLAVQVAMKKGSFHVS